MARADRISLSARIAVGHPVPGVLHSLQQDDAPLDPKMSVSDEPLAFDFPLQIERTPDGGVKFFGPQVRREGKERRFVYIRIGQSAGQCLSPWSRRMKIDIHNIDPALLDRAAKGGVLVGSIDGTAPDGSPACATIRPVVWTVV